MKKINMDDVKAAGSNQRLVPGGYVIQITKAVDVPEKEYISFEYEIVEGDLKGYSGSMLERLGWTECKFTRFYREKSLPFFKAFLEAIDNTNHSNLVGECKTGLDEAHLIKKGLGVIIGNEQYKKKDGTIGIRTYVAEYVTAGKIREGEFTVPELKLLDGYTAPVMTEVADDGELPF